MVTKVKTDKKSTKQRTKAFAAAVMGKPSGQILERVKPAAPEHFGIVLERDVAGLLVKVPWVLLISHPRINVVSAAELAAETGPIEHYASAKAITGRAGLFPSRYQSDGVDRGGKLSRFRNARMRSAWLMAAESLLKANDDWQGKFNRQHYNLRRSKLRQPTLTRVIDNAVGPVAIVLMKMLVN